MSRLVFDIGGTHMRMAFADSSTLSRVETVSTPHDPSHAITLLKAFGEDTQATEAVGGIAGIVVSGTVMDAPNLDAWNGCSFAATLKDALKVPVRVYNDAELAAIGEARDGAGKGYERVGYLSIGTGVGGALISKEEGHFRISGSEPGRLVLDQFNGQTLEGLVGGASLARGFGVRPEALAQSVYDERTPMLAEGIRALLALWAPDIVVLNGPLIYGAPAFNIDALTHALSEYVDGFLPPLVLASFKDESGIRGAAGI